MRSCAVRDSRRSRLPNSTSGSTTTGTTSSTSAVSFGLVTSSMTRAPASSSALRSHCETAEPISACSTEMSAVSRARMSPVRAVSKKAGDNDTMRSNRSRLRSAAIRSPSQDTRV